MLSTVTVTTPPTQEPVTLSLARQHCRIDHNADDALISAYLTAARMMVEQYTSRVFLTQTLTWTMTPERQLPPHLPMLPWNAPLVLPRGPVQSIGSVTVQDMRGNVTAIPAATLPVVPPSPLLGWMADLNHIRARLWIGPQTVLTDGRTLGSAALQTVQIAFVAGFASAGDVPQPMIQALLLTTAFLYEQRGDAGGELPQAAQWLLDPYRVIPV
jgi:uncharacterized phiE125 gp8 family phage protein